MSSHDFSGMFAIRKCIPIPPPMRLQTALYSDLYKEGTLLRKKRFEKKKALNRPKSAVFSNCFRIA